MDGVCFGGSPDIICITKASDSLDSLRGSSVNIGTIQRKSAGIRNANGFLSDRATTIIVETHL